MSDAELTHVLDQHDPLAWRHLGQHGAQEGRLAAAGATGDEEGLSLPNQSHEHGAGRFVEHAGLHEI
jgi:hypothetical protein